MRREDICKIFANIPTVKTDRLILRKVCGDDVEDMYEYSCNPGVTEFLTWSPHPDKICTLEYISYLQSRYRTGDFYDWAVVVKADGKMIGTCGFTRFDYDNNAAEVGYVINPEYRGRGVAPEALARVLEFGFTELKLNRIEARYIVGNEVSRRVMEKVGMKFEGIRRQSLLNRGEYVDVGYCSILASEYFG